MKGGGLSMKLDITRLPVVEGVVVFFIIVLGVTFAGAFAATNSGGEEAAVAESPTPDETPENGATPSDGRSPSPGGPMQVVMQDDSFDPNELTVAAGSTAVFEISNEGSSRHNMHIAGEGNEFTEDFCEGGGDPCSDPNSVDGGETATLTWQVPPEPGQVDFRCDFHPEDMTGTITSE
jgi:plastocyanin